jgi:L-2-hydroxyglutarate oxidase LhgO
MDVDTIVIGAGAVGLACAAAVAKAGREVIVLERAGGFGTGISSRNSEVIHAGIYYPTDSLKRALCVEGRRRLYPYLEVRGVAHRRCGKLIVATSDAETDKIQAIFAQGQANDVEGLQLLTGAQAMAMEPALSCTAAVLSPETGVFDSHGYMLALLGEIEDAGGALALNTGVDGIEPLAAGGFRVRTHGADATALNARCVVNAAGLHAPAVAARIEGLPAAALPTQTLAKGSYFGCAGRPAFSRLIYPVPADGGLGVHVTLDLAGRMRFGPDVEWLDETDPDRVDYHVDPRRADSFYAAVRTYWPALPDGAITPDYAGCRPKLSRRGEPTADFRIDGADVHGLAGLVNLFGIESPGLTSSLAIAERVRGATSL